MTTLTTTILKAAGKGLLFTAKVVAPIVVAQVSAVAVGKAIGAVENKINDVKYQKSIVPDSEVIDEENIVDVETEEESREI